METNFLDVGILLTSICLIIFTILKFKLHPFFSLASCRLFVRLAMNMQPLEMINAIENGIGSLATRLSGNRHRTGNHSG